MTIRLRMWLLSLLIALDQFVHVLLAGPKYILIGGARPDPDETISGKVGRSSARGKRWARIAEWIIDGLFRLIGAGRGHCRAAAAREQARKCNG